MARHPAHLRSLAFFCFFCLIHSQESQPCLSSAPCGTGRVSKDCMCPSCPHNTHWVVKQGVGRCERCTLHCSAERKLKQVRACSVSSNRVCHCDVGFYCSSPLQYTCRRCKPCPAGTFSNVTSLSTHCRRHTDCATLGMSVIAWGNMTNDHICASKTVQRNPGL